jgi:hypothetical protein
VRCRRLLATKFLDRRHYLLSSDGKLILKKGIFVMFKCITHHFTTYLKISYRVEGCKQAQKRYTYDDDILPDANFFALNLFSGHGAHRTHFHTLMKCCTLK